MFRFAVVGIFLGLGWGFFGGHRTGTTFDPVSLALLVPCVVLIGAALAHWATHPDGIRDTWAGGSVSLKHTNPHWLEWSDWALWMTHAGRIDRRANMVRVEKRLLLGLIPVGTTIKSTREFNQANVDSKVQTTTYRRRGFFFNSYHTEATHLTLTLVLTNNQGERLTLLDLNTALGGSRGERFMSELKRLVEEAIANPG
jgi:hypothetical protein